VRRLRQYSVFFSEPLDLDLSMLEAFPGAYQALIPAGGGPRTTVEKAAEVVLGSASALDAYTDEYAKFREHLPAYRYHFLTHSKPATHLAALTHMQRIASREAMPEVLSEILNHMMDRMTWLS
jgi:putative ATP-dependent endonuclease of OLD family